jgi:hypothetical protein
VFNVFKQRLAAEAVAQKLVEGTDPADLLKLCQGRYAAADLERLFSELLTLQIFLVDYNLWFAIADAAQRKKVLDAYYPLATAATSLGSEFYRTEAFVERMRTYGAAMKGAKGLQGLVTAALGYFSLKPGAPESAQPMEASLTLYCNLMSKTIQSALKKVLILEPKHAH